MLKVNLQQPFGRDERAASKLQCGRFYCRMKALLFKKKTLILTVSFEPKLSEADSFIHRI